MHVDKNASAQHLLRVSAGIEPLVQEQVHGDHLAEALALEKRAPSGSGSKPKAPVLAAALTSDQVHAQVAEFCTSEKIKAYFDAHLAGMGLSKYEFVGFNAETFLNAFMSKHGQDNWFNDFVHCSFIGLTRGNVTLEAVGNAKNTRMEEGGMVDVRRLAADYMIDLRNSKARGPIQSNTITFTRCNAALPQVAGEMLHRGTANGGAAPRKVSDRWSFGVKKLPVTMRFPAFPGMIAYALHEEMSVDNMKHLIDACEAYQYCFLDTIQVFSKSMDEPSRIAMAKANVEMVLDNPFVDKEVALAFLLDWNVLAGATPNHTLADHIQEVAEAWAAFEAKDHKAKV